MLNRPRYYNLFMVTIRCHGCGEEYIFPDILMSREIPKGEAFSPPKPDAPVWNIPIHKKEITERRDVPFCMMCVDQVEKVDLPPIPTGVLRSGSNATPTAQPKLDLGALGLLNLDITTLGKK